MYEILHIVEQLTADISIVDGKKVSIGRLGTVYVLTLDADEDQEPLATCNAPEHLGRWAWRWGAYEVRHNYPKK